VTDAHPLPQGNGKPPGTTSASGSITAVGGTMQSYYGRPLLKEPIWKPEVPLYFFFGGLAGASSVVSLVARATGNMPLARATLYIGAAADVVSPALLISDLGRPERFYNMMRVFKPTSPMSVGSWILLVSGGASSTAALLELSGRLPRLKLAAEVASTLSGPPLSTYTGVLVANTAVPAWHEARRDLPVVFGLSSLASAGAAAVTALHPRHTAPARRLAVWSAVAEVALAQRMERRLGFVGEPYHQGQAGLFGRLAKAGALAGAGLLAWRGRRSRPAAVAGGAVLLAAEMALRWSVFTAGKQSARDPRYTVLPQRERLAA
jgi:hypothetical protein